jgi:hypothetical protein
MCARTPASRACRPAKRGGCCTAASSPLPTWPRPECMDVDAGATVALFVPRDALDALLPQPLDLHGVVPTGACAGMFADHVAELARQMPRMRPEEVEGARLATLHLLAASLAPTAAMLAVARPAVEGALRRQVCSYIEHNLTDEALHAQSLCERFRVSRSMLYRLFEPLGGVANHIKERRLARVRTALASASRWQSVARNRREPWVQERHAFQPGLSPAVRLQPARCASGVARGRGAQRGWRGWGCRGKGRGQRRHRARLRPVVAGAAWLKWPLAIRRARPARRSTCRPSCSTPRRCRRRTASSAGARRWRPSARSRSSPRPRTPGTCAPRHGTWRACSCPRASTARSAWRARPPWCARSLWTTTRCNWRTTARACACSTATANWRWPPGSRCSAISRSRRCCRTARGASPRCSFRATRSTGCCRASSTCTAWCRKAPAVRCWSPTCSRWCCGCPA